MEERGVVRLACERVGGGKVKVAARFNGEAVHLDVLDLASAAARQRFVKALCEKLPAADPAALDSELLRLADVAPASAGPADEGFRPGAAVGLPQRRQAGGALGAVPALGRRPAGAARPQRRPRPARRRQALAAPAPGRAVGGHAARMVGGGPEGVAGRGAGA